MTTRSYPAILAGLAFLLAACDNQPAPTAAISTHGLAALAAGDSGTDSGGGGGGAGRILLNRSDSLSRTAQAWWYEGTVRYFVAVNKSQMPGTRTAFLAYGANDTSLPWWPLIFIGYGQIPASDVTGSGVGSFAVHTNTAADPGFTLMNAAGGQVDVVWRQVPQSAFRYHDAGQWEWPPFVYTINSAFQYRQATATGAFPGRTLPDSLEAFLNQSWGHTAVYLMSGF